MNISPLKIGNVVSSPNLVLAPMSGVTNSSFRRLLREENPDSLGLVVTEFISIEGLTRGNERTKGMLKFVEFERPLAIQIFGYDIERMVEAAKMVEDAGADIVDINCGCPVPKFVKRGGGCELMRQPEHLEKMLTEVVKAVNIPVTLKIRSGWDDKNLNGLKIGKMAESVGIKALAVHGRTRQQLYRGVADWEVVAEIAAELKIPVIGSGDVVDGPSTLEALKKGVSAVMIGRGAMENPFIFSQIKDYLDGKIPVHKPSSEFIRALIRYYELLMDDVGPRATVGKMKQLISQASKRIPGGAEKRRQLCTMSGNEDIHIGLLRWHEELLEKNLKNNDYANQDSEYQSESQFYSGQV